MPQAYGKYVFGEITTGRLLYCDLAEMIAADDGSRSTMAAIHELQIVFDSPYDSPDQGIVNRRMFDIEAETYTNKLGQPGSQKLPGGAAATNGSDIDGVPYGKGRADIRLAMGGDGELYVLSKSDGMIRQVQGPPAPIITSIKVTNGIVTLTWHSIPAHSYRAQFKSALADANWTDLSGDVIAAGQTASKTNTVAAAARYYRVVLLP
jgi:hypothetical protein